MNAPSIGDGPLVAGRSGRAFRGSLGGRPIWVGRRRREGEARWCLGLRGGFGPPVALRRGDGEMWLGHPDFDRLVRVAAEEGVARAALAVPVRQLLRRLFAVGVIDVGWGPQGLRTTGPREWRADDARAAGEALGALVGALEARPPICDALLEVALSDPEVRARAGAAEALLRRLRDADETTVARACAALAASTGVRPRLRLDALWVLETFAPRLAGPVLHGLVGVDAPVAGAVLERLGALAVREAEPDLARRAHDRDPRVAAAALFALGALEAPWSEPLALERLCAGPEAVREAAAALLGEIGAGPVAARALDRVGRSKGETPGVRRAARQALLRLQERLPGPGALALPPRSDEGALSQTLDVDEPAEETSEERLRDGPR